MGSAIDRDDLQRSILRIVEYNTGGPQPETVAEHVIVQLASRADYEPGVVRDALDTLVADGALERVSSGPVATAPRYSRPAADG